MPQSAKTKKPVQFSKLKVSNATVRIEVPLEGGETLSVYGQNLSVGNTRRFTRAANVEDFDAIVEEFLKLFTRWDVVDENGADVPLNEENVDQLDMDVFQKISAGLGKLASLEA